MVKVKNEDRGAQWVDRENSKTTTKKTNPGGHEFRELRVQRSPGFPVLRMDRGKTQVSWILQSE